MAAIILPQKWAIKPNGPVRVNWSNPITQDLAVALIPGSPEAVSGGPLVIANGASLAPGPDGLGFATAAASSDDVVYAPSGHVGIGTGNLTDIALVHLTGEPTNFTYAMGSYSGATNGVMMTLRHTSAGSNWGVYESNAGALLNSEEGGILAAGRHVLVHTRDGTTHRLYRNAVLRNSISSANTDTTTNAVCAGNILTSGGSFSPGPVANIPLVARFKRCLSAEEVIEISHRPWQIFAPLRRRLYFFGAAAATSYDQEGFRWRYDDGDEDGATFSAAQDEPSAASIGITKRLRVLVDVTGNPGSPAAEQFQLQYRRTGSPTEEWKKVN